MTAAAALAGLLGVVLLLGGTGHFAGISRRFLARGLPDGHRVAFLIFVGVLQLAGGGLNLIARGGLRDGEAWARRVSLVACALVIAYAASVLPLLGQASLFLRVAPAAYLVLHAALLALLLLRR
jgi:hypothetical protein